ncbi:DNA polymerase III subunit epsilon [Saliniramus sp.]|uniref:DNA polymerase III subunit epsilon n=1 Tax=Saliniramus sp. TaxID=2986772 RepID=UPI002C395FFC|nr:DNA polymerase III subunit epsilon [Saliniramus sp.]HMB09328.1 DNA polymerase III subunit epsilon [Saliniramus sp.]
MLREIVLDTETTGTDHAAGDRVIEIGCVEMINHIPTGESYHVYINPQCPVSAGALAVHGLSDEFLADKPLFNDIAASFAAFIRDARLVIHNAPFDVGFLNAEFRRIGLDLIRMEDVLDTLSMARRKHPGAPNNLDALCNRYNIDNTRRTRHGALLDAEILAEVYIELIGGKQTDLGLAVTQARAEVLGAEARAGAPRERRIPPQRLTDAEREAHARFLADFKGEPIWRDYVAGN